MLQFFGRGSAFTDKHNSAFFVDGRDLVLVDCPASSFPEIKRLNFSEIDNIYILVTHTHGDHSGGVGMTAQYAYFILHNPITVVAPSEQVAKDLQYLLTVIEGCEDNWFKLITSDKLQKNWLVKSVLTVHTATLENKCFGYCFRIDGVNVVYTGDTATLELFLPYLNENDCLFSEISAYSGGVHLLADDVLPVLQSLSEKGINVYVMHIDNEEIIKNKIQGTKIRLAPLVSEGL